LFPQKESREKNEKEKKQSKHAQRTKEGLLCPHIHAEDETKGMTEKTNDLTIEGLIAKENEKRAVEQNSIRKSPKIPIIIYFFSCFFPGRFSGQTTSAAGIAQETSVREESCRVDGVIPGM